MFGYICYICWIYMFINVSMNFQIRFSQLSRNRTKMEGKKNKNLKRGTNYYITIKKLINGLRMSFYF